MSTKIVDIIKGLLILSDTLPLSVYSHHFYFLFKRLESELSEGTSVSTHKRSASFSASSRDDDDINDVASMAGVNLSEESARILATNSELVGSVTRSCKDETFLSTSSLSRRALEIGEASVTFERRNAPPRLRACLTKRPLQTTGKKFGVSELGPDVVNFISHATQQRLQNLMEKVTQVAQLKNLNLKVPVHDPCCRVKR